MPSFDIVSELDLQEVDNAVNQTVKEITGRFDFKATKSEVNFLKDQKMIKVVADDDMKLRSIHQILETKMAKRGLDCRSLDYKKPEVASGGILRQEITLKVGLTKEEAKKITQIIKDSKLKVQPQIQDDQVRVTAKKIDDLQSVIGMLKESNTGIPMQFINMRS